jgi:hypothetical protein
LWDYDSLWTKARLYAARAASEDHDSALFPFWSILALELLARAALASVHPVLLADPREGQNLMYALGYGQPRAPKSVTAKTVFLRCAQVIQTFTDEDDKRATALIEMRNEELHSGGTPLEGLHSRVWLLDYYRLIETLLDHLEMDLTDFFDADEATTARRMMDAGAEATLGEVQKAIAEQRKAWESLSERSKAGKIATADAEAKSRDSRTWYYSGRAGTRRKCPSCSTEGWITGEVVRTSEPRAGEDTIFQTFTKWPTRFECFACGLTLSGEAQLHAAELGDLYSIEIGEDPASFYGIETRADYSEFESDPYGND